MSISAQMSVLLEGKKKSPLQKILDNLDSGNIKPGESVDIMDIASGKRTAPSMMRIGGVRVDTFSQSMVRNVYKALSARNQKRMHTLSIKELLNITMKLH